MEDKQFQKRISETVRDVFPLDRVIPVETVYSIFAQEYKRTNKVEDVVNVGDKVQVKVKEIDDMGRINLTMKELLPKPNGFVDRPLIDRGPRPPRRDVNRGGRRAGNSGRR